MKTCFLTVFGILTAGLAAAGTFVIPGADFDTRPTGTSDTWRLTGTGAWMPTEGTRGSGAVAVEGDGKSDARWHSPAVTLEPDHCYAFSFDTCGEGAGSLVSGVCGDVAVNVDLPAVTGGWRSFTNVFRTPSVAGPVRETFHLGQWHMRGRALFDNASLVPVRAVYAVSGDVRLGAGEEIDNHKYSFTSRFNGISRNEARPLVGYTNTSFNTTRWAIGGSSCVTYRHAIPGQRLTSARVTAVCCYRVKGLTALEVSTDGKAWTEIGTITNVSTVTCSVPSTLLPAEAVWVRFRGKADCTLQISGYSFDADLDGAPLTFLGSTRFVDAEGRTVCEMKAPSFYESDYGERLPSSDDRLTLWRASSGWKIPRTRILPKASSTAAGLVIRTARNEAEATQLVVTPRSNLHDVRVTANALVCGAASLDASAVEILRVGYVRITQTTDAVGCRSEWPDPLPPQKGCLDVPADRNQPFWVRVKPPKGTPAGTYRGTIHVTAAGGVDVCVPLTVEVFDFTLPDEMTCETGFGFNPGTVARYHGLKEPGQRTRVFDRYLQALADHHISPYNPTPDVSWSVRWEGLSSSWDGGVKDRAVKFSGLSSVRVTDDQTKGNVGLLLHDPISLPAGGVRLSFRHKTDKGQTFTVSFQHFRADGSWMSGRNRDVRVKGGADWQLFETVYKNYPKDAARVRLTFYPAGFQNSGSGTGTLWLDDVSLVSLNDGKECVPGGDFEPPDVTKAEPIFDWSAWDTAMEAAFAKYHFNSFVIRLAGLGGGTFESRTEPSYLGFAGTTPEYDVLMGKYLKGIEAHLREKGWLDKAYVYWFDEPDVKDYDFVMRGFHLLKKHAPGIRRMLTEEALPALHGGPNLWVPLTPNLHVSGEAAARAAGDRFWWYVCCGPRAPYVTEFTDHPGSEMRLWLWQTWGENVQGILIWETVYWSSTAAYPDLANPQNPYEDPMSWCSRNQTVRKGMKSPWGNGDGRFLYPPLAAANGRPAAPVLEDPVVSYRLEMLRDGLEDYEYFVLLKRLLSEKGDALPAAERAAYTALLTVPKEVYSSLISFTIDPKPMETHRLKLARAIVRLSSLRAPVAAAAPVWPTPTAEMKPWTYNWWMGSAVDAAGLEYQCKELSDKGFGGFHVIPIYGAKGGHEKKWKSLLSPEWIEAWNLGARTARKYGLGIDLTMGSGWCFGGPWITTNDAASSLMKVKRAGPGGQGYMIDPFSPAAMSNHVARFAEVFTRKDVERPRAFYHDSYEYFKARPKHGEDVDAAQTACFKVWTDWCRAQGYLTRNEAHGSPANWIDLYALADIPETEMFGKKDRSILVSKFASSAAHIKGTRLVAAESCTWIDEHFNERPDEIKRFLDLLFLSGVNHVFYQGLCYSPLDVVWPGWCFYASLEMNPRNPIWREVGVLNAYVTRCQSIFQTWTWDGDLFVLWDPETFRAKHPNEVRQMTVHSRDWFEGEEIGKTARELWEAGYQFDYVSAKLLRKDMNRDRAKAKPSPFRADNGLSSTRWEKDGKVLYFVVNTSGRRKRVSAVRPFTVMDPMTGTIRRTECVRLEDGQSLFLEGENFQVCGDTESGPAWRPLTVCKGWKIEPVCGGPTRPAPVIRTSLAGWETWDDAFSGTMRYTAVFDGDAFTELDLGDVREIARVRLNGSDLGCVFMAPYRFAVPTNVLKAAGNILDVEVTNLGANRLRWNDRNGVRWKYFSDINMVDINYHTFDASGWTPRASGLLGPVSCR